MKGEQKPATNHIVETIRKFIFDIHGSGIVPPIAYVEDDNYKVEHQILYVFAYMECLAKWKVLSTSGVWLLPTGRTHKGYRSALQPHLSSGSQQWRNFAIRSPHDVEADVWFSNDGCSHENSNQLFSSLCKKACYSLCSAIFSVPILPVQSSWCWQTHSVLACFRRKLKIYASDKLSHPTNAKLKTRMGFLV